MISGIIKPLFSLIKEQELSRIIHYKDKCYYKGAYKS
jgi:hypothetical protein